MSFVNLGDSKSPFVVQAGTIIIGGQTVPSGYLLCDGQPVSRTLYSALFAVIGTSFGVGDGSTTFNLPDLVGAVPRGSGISTGYAQNVTVTFGQKLDDAIQSHTHTFSDDFFAAVGGATSGGSPFYGQGSSVSDITGNHNGRSANETRVKSLGVNFFIKV